YAHVSRRLLHAARTHLAGFPRRPALDVPRGRRLRLRWVRWAAGIRPGGSSVCTGPGAAICACAAPAIHAGSAAAIHAATAAHEPRLISSMIPKSGTRFSEKIMREQMPKAGLRFEEKSSRFRMRPLAAAPLA